ncbi:MAG: hypothetical protein NTV54_13915, partial [Ignavibacteriales bacterium]|nr:hypothetical protein [Ignavibacteriales bacterium]
MNRSAILLIVLFCAAALYSNLLAQWTRQNSGTTQTLTDVVMLDSVTAVVSGRNRSVLRTTNSG